MVGIRCSWRLEIVVEKKVVLEYSRWWWGCFCSFCSGSNRFLDWSYLASSFSLSPNSIEKTVNVWARRGDYQPVRGTHPTGNVFLPPLRTFKDSQTDIKQVFIDDLELTSEKADSVISEKSRVNLRPRQHTETNFTFPSIILLLTTKYYSYQWKQLNTCNMERSKNYLLYAINLTRNP